MSEKKPRWYYCKTWRCNFYFYVGWEPNKFLTALKEKLRLVIEIAELGLRKNIKDPYATAFSIWLGVFDN